MANSLARALVCAMIAAVVLGCALTGSPVEGLLPQLPSASPPTVVPAPPSAAPATPAISTDQPGLLLSGSVLSSDGSPLQRVAICLSFASYPGNRVAITEDGGRFQADFVAIPGDEMIMVWPYLEGYSFDPPRVYWRHYHGLETTTLLFTGTPLEPPASPPTPCH